MRRVALAVLALVVPAATACSAPEEGAGPTVTVVRSAELAPPALRRVEAPAARYLAESDAVVVVSAPLFSGSCPPTAEAEEDGATLLLTVEDSQGEGACTADANPYTFLVQDVAGTPRRLVVEGAGQGRVELDLDDGNREP